MISLCGSDFTDQTRPEPRLAGSREKTFFANTCTNSSNMSKTKLLLSRVRSMRSDPQSDISRKIMPWNCI